MSEKIKVAFVKFGGLSSGGIEKHIQTIATSLPPDLFEVDFFYTKGAPLIGTDWVHPTTDPVRKEFMENSHVNLIYVEVEARENRFGPPYEWINTNFWDLFDEEKYDIVQTARTGYREYPFCEMEDAIIVDGLHGDQIDIRSNIEKYVFLSEFQRDGWLRNGGIKEKSVIIPPLIKVPPKKPSTLRKDLGIGGDVLLYGMHQADRDDIFSMIPLKAYKEIEENGVDGRGDIRSMYVLLGGSKNYRTQAEELGLENVIFLDFNSDPEYIHNFIAGLDIYTHGRHDGEVCSSSIIEALYHGKPVITHPGTNMGHGEQIRGCGFMAPAMWEYCKAMRDYANPDTRKLLSERCIEKYKSEYSFETALQKYIDLYTQITKEKRDE